MVTNLSTRSSPFQQLSGVHGYMGQCQKSREEFAEALRLEPSDQANYSNLAATYLTLGRIDEAKALLDQAQSHNMGGEQLLQTYYYAAFMAKNAPEMDRLVSAGTGLPGTEDILFATDRTRLHIVDNSGRPVTSLTKQAIGSP